MISKQYLKDNLLKIKVVPNSSRQDLVEEKTGLKLYLKAPPEKNKANQELIKFFKQKLNWEVEVVKGAKNRVKTLKLID